MLTANMEDSPTGPTLHLRSLHFFRGSLSGQPSKNSLHIMAMQDRKTQYSWKSTSLSLLLSKLLISFWNAASSVLLPRKLGSSLVSSSLSSVLFSLNLSPSLPEYLWKVDTITSRASSKGLAMVTVETRPRERKPSSSKGRWNRLGGWMR